MNSHGIFGMLNFHCSRYNPPIIPLGAAGFENLFVESNSLGKFCVSQKPQEI